MDAANNNLYDGLSPNGMSPNGMSSNGMSPHDTGFEFNAFDGEAFTGSEQTFVEPLSGPASPGYAMQYDMGFNSAEHYPSPSDRASSPAGSGVSMDGMHPSLTAPLPQQPMVSAHIRNHPGSVSSVASSATAVSHMSRGTPVLNTDGTLIKEEQSPVPMMGHVSPPMNAAALATAAPTTGPACAPEPSPTNAKAPAKRKRENRYKNAPPAVLSRRRAQNRASQRAYRERKDQRIRDLETELNNCRAENESCKEQMANMHTLMMSMRVSTSLPGPNGPNNGPNSRAASMSAMPPHVQMHGQVMPNGQMVSMQQLPMGMMDPSMMVMPQGFGMPPQGFSM